MRRRKSDGILREERESGAFKLTLIHEKTTYCLGWTRVSNDKMTAITEVADTALRRYGDRRALELLFLK